MPSASLSLGMRWSGVRLLQVTTSLVPAFSLTFWIWFPMVHMTLLGHSPENILQSWVVRPPPMDIANDMGQCAM